ncbi:ATP-binding protein [Nocardia aobensis]|uniref:ATP-binding protein n=1 Tax=Nocardia aobensis TaxID=257277 RepID=A0ABW6P9W4_9NOCA
MTSANEEWVGRLPAELTTFVGRRPELLDLKQAFSTSRLVTLVGPGGVGKTRLALHAATTARRAFRNGSWFVDISPLRDEELLAPTIAAALNLRDISTRWAPSVLAAQLVGKQLLLILDNCEYLSYACAVMVDALLKECPDLRVLATSRQPLDVAGEQLFVVRPLPTPIPAADGSVAADLDGYDAVTLFVDRARAADPSFALTADNARAVAELCYRVDGLPLAVELAAARIRHLSVQQILDRLDERYGILQSGSRSLAPRQRSLRSLIGWSHELCTPEEQVLWARLTVFSGSFSAEAAEAVCTDDDVPPETFLDTLAGLVDKSIVSIERHGGSRVRYRMLETIRTFGAERLSATDSERRQLRRRHQTFYCARLSRGLESWFGPGQVELMQWIAAERDNIRTAIEFSLGESGAARMGAILGASLGGVGIQIGLVREGRRWTTDLLDAIPEPCAERALLLWIGGWCALQEGELDEAEAMLQDAGSVARHLRDGGTAAIATALLGSVRLTRGDLSGAAQVLESALEGVEPENTMARVLVEIRQGVTKFRLGEVRRGIELCRAAVALCEERDELWHRSEALWELATMYWEVGDIDRADSSARDALRIHRLFGHLVGSAQCFETLAWIACRRRQYERTAQLLGAADAIWQSTEAAQVPRALGHRESTAEAARKALGDRKYGEARRAGTRNSAVSNTAFALGESPATAEGASQSPMIQLTEREREVAELIAEGTSNKDIAATLVISPRTVEGHVEHILAKLGFTSRVQVASWVASVRAGSA